MSLGLQKVSYYDACESLKIAVSEKGPYMNKILVVSVRINGSAMAKKIAEENPSIIVHLIGAKIDGKLPGNLFQLGELTNSYTVLKKLKEIHMEYDFIYASDFPFQFNVDFQEWRNTINVPVLCVTRECSFLEFSKLKLKTILKELDIPHPSFEILIEDDWGKIEDIKNPAFLNNKFMLKMDKSMVMTGHQSRISNAQNYKKSIYQSRHLGASYFVEEYINGSEISAHFLCNGSDWMYIGSARDYKKMYENDQGQNCSSSGCYSPVDYVNDHIKSQMFSYMDKIMSYLNSRGFKYNGIMYLGLIIDSTDTVNILEINTRPGNPEFNTIVSNIKSGLLENLKNSALGLPFSPIEFNDTVSVSVNILTENYSIGTNNGITEPVLSIDDDVTICYFNEKIYGTNNIFANILKTSNNIGDAATSLNKSLNSQSMDGYRFRQDIGILR